MKILRMENVHMRRGYGARSSEVLKGISISIRSGDIVLLEGPSGSGKTTLLSLAAGLLMPDRGSVIIDGVATAGLSQHERRNLRLAKIGFVFQQANLLSQLTVLQNVMMMATLTGTRLKKAQKDAYALLGDLGIDGLANRFPHELSGGEEQRVAVARALVHNPKIVLADEPTGNLDKESGYSVAEALVSAAHTRDAAVMIATHDYRLKTFASRLITIDDGQTYESQSP